MAADGTLSLTSIGGTVHTMKTSPVCATPEFQLIDRPTFKPRLHSAEVSGAYLQDILPTQETP